MTWLPILCIIAFGVAALVIARQSRSVDAAVARPTRAWRRRQRALRKQLRQSLGGRP